MAVELPGYFYDTEKRRYFKITNSINASTELSGNKYSRDVLNNVKVNLLGQQSKKAYTDPYKIQDEYLKDRSIRYMVDNNVVSKGQIFKQSESSASIVSTNNITFPYSDKIIAAQDVNYIEDGLHRTKTLYITSAGQILETRIDSPPNTAILLFRPEDTEESTIDLANFEVSQYYLGLVLVHMVGSHGKNILFWSVQNRNETINFRSKVIENKYMTYVTLLDPNHIFYLLGNKLHFVSSENFSFDNKLILYPKERSYWRLKGQITCVKFNPIDNETYRIYAGSRNGILTSFIFSVKYGVMPKSVQTWDRPGNLITIVSMLSTNIDGIIFVSGLTNKKDHSQTIIALNTKSLLPNLTHMLTLKSHFRNVTQSTEIFLLNQHENILLYGCKRGVRVEPDFEIFKLDSNSPINDKSHHILPNLKFSSLLDKKYFTSPLELIQIVGEIGEQNVKKNIDDRIFIKRLLIKVFAKVSHHNQTCMIIVKL